MPKQTSAGISLMKLGEAGRAVRAQLARSAKESGRALDILDAFLRTHLEYLAANPEAGRALYAASFRDGDEKAGPGRGRTGRSHLAALEKIFAAARKEKSLRADVDPAMAAIHFLGVIQMAWTYWTIAGGRTPLPELGARLYKQFLAGVAL